MSRANIVMERILNSLDNDPKYHSSLLCRTIGTSSFGSVMITMFIMPVGDNDVNAEMNERRILAEMQEENIYVAFHKTRRQEGERLITVTKPLEPKHINFTYGNLKGFTKLWLIEATDAARAVREAKEKAGDGKHHRTIGRF